MVEAETLFRHHSVVVPSPVLVGVGIALVVIAVVAWANGRWGRR